MKPRRPDGPENPEEPQDTGEPEQPEDPEEPQDPEEEEDPEEPQEPQGPEHPRSRVRFEHGRALRGTPCLQFFPVAHSRPCVALPFQEDPWPTRSPQLQPSYNRWELWFVGAMAFVATNIARSRADTTYN